MPSIPLIQSEQLSPLNEVRFAMSTRHGGVSPSPFGMNLSFQVGDDHDNVLENRRLFFGSLGLDHERIAFPHQHHSNTVALAESPGEYQACDGLTTSQPNLPLVVTLADCLPIVLFDVQLKVLALVHAGWRGTALRILENAIRLMGEEFRSSSSDLIVYMGPGAGVCCYEVGPEVADQFPDRVIERRLGRTFLDLKQANLQQLLSWGVRRERIEISSLCTVCHPEQFHSYRRDKERSGRMMAVASLVAQ